MSEAYPDVEAEAVAEAARRNARAATRRLWLTRLGLVVGLIALIWGGWYLLVGRNYVSTDDAYVNAEAAQVTPLLSASALAVHVKDTQAVAAGDVLVELDPANARIALAQAEADLALARQHYAQAQANGTALAGQTASRDAEVAAAQARAAAADADLDKARLDVQRRAGLAASGGVSGEELSNARHALAGAQAAREVARAAVAQARANRQNAAGQFAANDALLHGTSAQTDPGVLVAKARLDSARLDLAHSVIRAPIAGVITRRQVQVGQRVTAGAVIMTIIPVGAVYVDANFKERQLGAVRLGMPAQVVADLYGSSVTYHGRVAGIAGGTGASQAIIPAQNASGNWIKVVQRLPVRIELDRAELVAHPLRVGLSAEVTVHLVTP